MKYVRSLFVFIVSLLFFIILEYGQVTVLVKEMVQPVIFALVMAFIYLNSNLRVVLFWFALSLIILMILSYLFNLLPFANWTGSLGVGILIILIVSYIPQIIKKGFIDRF